MVIWSPGLRRLGSNGYLEPGLQACGYRAKPGLHLDTGFYNEHMQDCYVRNSLWKPV